MKKPDQKTLLERIEHEDVFIIIVSVLSLIFSFLSWWNTLH